VLRLGYQYTTQPRQMPSGAGLGRGRRAA